jgi:hypothetical protein
MKITLTEFLRSFRRAREAADRGDSVIVKGENRDYVFERRAVSSDRLVQIIGRCLLKYCGAAEWGRVSEGPIFSAAKDAAGLAAECQLFVQRLQFFPGSVIAWL